MSYLNKQLEGKISLFTGATSGIGKVTATELAKAGAHVIVQGRSLEKTDAVRQEIIAQSGNENVDILVGNLFSLAETRRLAAEVNARYPRLDVLVNNAGGILGSAREQTDEGFEKTIALNHLSPFVFTSLLFNKLRQSTAARIINVSSKAHVFANIDWNDFLLQKSYQPLLAYANAKLYSILFTQELARKISQKNITNVTVNALHPGGIATGFAKNSSWPIRVGFRILMKPFLLTAAQGADNSIYLATSNDVAGVNGQYFVKRKPARPRKKYITPENAAHLWQLSEKLTGAEFGIG